MSSIVTSPTSQRRPGVGSLSKAVNEPEAIAANLVVYRQMGLRHPYASGDASRPRQSFQLGTSNGAIIVMPSQDGSTSHLDESQNLDAVLEEPMLLAEERGPTNVPSSTTIAIEEL
ncbi:hypothetical protein MRB53_033008 [Persea americana]|uniref:Uncharacterized protein n=1 Tax=Persea americana TaxID=3435 RepID=A0ACC2KU10_PERAE|nr:hypothetical protein MRB53_033008 [Persea americana]